MSLDNIKVWFKWIGSLMNKWWLVFAVFVIGSLITGAGAFTLILVLLFAGLGVLVWTTKVKSIKLVYGMLVNHIVEWWNNRPRK